MIEHSRKHGAFDPRWLRRPLVAARAMNASRSNSAGADLLDVQAVARWEAEGGSPATTVRDEP